MPIALQRHGTDVDVYDSDAVRAWMKDRVEIETKLKGQPQPRIVLVFDGHEEVLDLDRMSRDDPSVDVGATFQSMCGRPGVERGFVVFTGMGQKETGETDVFGVILEQTEGPRWWVALLRYENDASTGVGNPLDWTESDGDTDDASLLWPFLRACATPPLDGRVAQVLPPRVEQPDIKVTYGEIRPDQIPADAVKMAEMSFAMVSQAVLTGDMSGSIVVKLTGVRWEVWILGGESLPTSLEDMLRYIAMMDPPADGMALVQLAIREEDTPPRPGLQLIAERAGQMAEYWCELESPNGPAGARTVKQVLLRAPRAVPEEGMWIGVDPMVTFQLGPIGVVED